MRINKFLAKAGIGSRRGVEKYITEGRVSVNGVIIKELSTKISSEDRVFFDGKEIRNHEEFVYYKLNKPVGFTTTLKDPYADRVIIDLIEDERRIYPIGRLDKDSCGLILLTNDGDFTYQLSHPKYHLSKTYKVRVEGRPKDSDIRKLEEGILLDGYKTKKQRFDYYQGIINPAFTMLYYGKAEIDKSEKCSTLSIIPLFFCKG